MFILEMDIEQSIRHYIRWNALLILKANKNDDLGGTYLHTHQHLPYMKLVLIISLEVQMMGQEI